MSSLYATEPATAGRVIMETTHGPLDIVLWCRECPLTTRYFLQLCTDGFYDNMLFHRIVPSLLIQTGAMRHNEDSLATTASANGQATGMASYRSKVQADEAIARRQYEVNPRIRFNHRGQVAMALGVSDDQDVEFLQPQFFITTEDAPYLDGKHVIYGTLGVGPTVFNAIRIAQVESDVQTHAPVDIENAPRILSTKIVDNPVHTDIVATQVVPWRPLASTDEASKKRKKRKGKLDVNVLSFGDEMEGEEIVKIDNSKSKREKGDKKPPAISDPDDAKAEVHNTNGTKESFQPLELSSKASATSRPVEAGDDGDSKVQPSKRQNPAKEVSAFVSKPNVESATAAEAHVEPAPTHEKLSLVEARRAKYFSKGGSKSKQQRDEETMAKLLAFRGKIHDSVAPKTSTASSIHGTSGDDSLASRMARRAQQEEMERQRQEDDDSGAVAYSGQVLNSDDGEGDDGTTWLKTKFKCRKHMDHLAGDGRNVDDYVVVDDTKRKSSSHHKRDRRR